MADPGYQFGLTQGRNAREGSAAARGGLYSGQTGKALTEFGTDYGTSKFNDAFNRQQTEFGNRWGRLAGLAGIGQAATNQVDAAGANKANNLGSLGLYGAQQQGAAGIANANIWGNALNQFAGSGAPAAIGRWWDSPPAASYSNEGRNYPTPLADGGPVRVRVRPPVEPMPSGTGGGLSREAVLQVLRANATDAAPAKTGIAALPTDYLRNPGGVRKAQMSEQGMADGGQVSDDGLTKLLNDMRVNEALIPPNLREQHRMDIAQRQTAFMERLKAMDPQARRELMAGSMRDRPMQINSGTVKQIGMADGGPVMVRVQTPTIGTTDPLPAGGGLSKDAILQVLRDQAANATDVPVREKAAGLKDGGKATKPYGASRGGAVKGPGGPREDKAGLFRLSDGEHVLRASAVTALGGGSNAKGQRRFSALQSLLDGGTNHAGA